MTRPFPKIPPLPDRAPHPARLDSLTGLRFFAALAVVLLHVENLLDPRILGTRLWSYGTLGVPFFFALSGFVLTWTARSDDRPRAFWRRRVARVVPLYLVTLVTGAVLVVALPIPAGQYLAVGSSAEKALIPLLSLTMLQAWISPHSGAFLFPSLASPNPPGWSLSDEAFFYALFPLLIIALVRMGRSRPSTAPGRSGAGSLSAVIAACGGFLLAVSLLVHGAEPANSNWPAYFPLVQIAFFIAGMATATAVRRQVRFPPLALCVMATALLAVGLYLAARQHLGISRELPLDEAISLPFILVLLGSAARADLAGAPSPFRQRRLVTLGVWSYALYLVQIPCFMVASCIFRHGLAGDRLTAALEALAVICTITAVAGLAHRFIEVPAERRLRHAPPPIILEQERPPVVTGPPGR